MIPDEDPRRKRRALALAALSLAWLACTASVEPRDRAPERGVEAWERLFESGERWKESNTEVAIDYFERARRAARDLPKDDPRRVRTEQRLGEGRRRQGRLDEAQKWLEGALATWRPVSDRDPALLAELLESRGLLRVMQGRLPEAEVDLAEAVEVRAAASGPGKPETAEARVNLAEVQRRLGRMQEAETNLIDAALVYGEYGPRYAIRIATIQNNLGLLYQQQERFQEAETQHRQAINLARSVQATDNPHVAIFSRALADLYLRTGRVDQAERLYTWSYETLERLLGPTHLETRLSESRLAELRERYGGSTGGGGP